MTLTNLDHSYPTFTKGETIEIKFLNKTIIGKFICWIPKEDRPFGYFLHIEQDLENFFKNLEKSLDTSRITSEQYSRTISHPLWDIFLSLNDQYILSINGNPFKCIPQ